MKRNFIFKLIMIIIIFLIIIPNFSRADSSLSWSQIDSDAKAFLKKGEEKDSVDESKMQDIVVPVAQILVAIGNVVVAVAVAVIAIKYMISNPENKAKLKTQLVGLVVATGVIFGAQIIWRVAYSFLSTL